MNEFIYIEFMFNVNDIDGIKSMMSDIDDLVILTTEYIHDAQTLTAWQKITGKISAETATMAKLSNRPYSKYMRTSYIPDHLKDMYRKR